ncbi:hypothetical protein MPSEU_000440700 [Mayamaea pseudoterrestris]|nr:hypothetical protein MPSEU_000440700 [Mayamaea pseudoterrestris]
MQFWEDVDDGLDDIENFWRKQNQDIDRIRTFAARAQGKLSLPTPSAAGHEPSEEHVDGLTTKPFWNAAEDLQLFPWAQDLEASAHIIQAEYETKLNTSMVFATDSIWQNQVMGQGWSAVRLQRLGVWNTETGWAQGKLTTIDTSFVHSTGNPTEQDRHVLIIDFWHPELTEAERSALEFVYDLRNKFENGQVPIRKPRSLQEQVGGLAGLWKSLTGGGVE